MTNTRLASNQQFLINYYIQEIHTWTLAILSEIVNLIVTAALNFRNLGLNKKQTLITKYLIPRL